MTKKRWAVSALVAAWAVLLVGLGVWYSHTGPPSVRAQSDLATGRAALDRAVATVEVQAQAPDVTVEVEPYQVSERCRLTVAWRGTEVAQDLVLTVPVGEEPAVLAGLADRLPPQWRVQHSTLTGRLSADAGDFVTVVGVPDSDGQVRITVATGCRPGTDPQLSQ